MYIRKARLGERLKNILKEVSFRSVNTRINVRVSKILRFDLKIRRIQSTPLDLVNHTHYKTRRIERTREVYDIQAILGRLCIDKR